jgi:glycosyltransferase involved in cell wall biosynthesis
MSNLVFVNAKQLIAPSEFMQELFSKYGYHNSVLIPNNISISNYPFRERKLIRPKILWVRSFASLYNPQLGIELVQRLKPIYPEIELCFVGPEKDGTMEDCKAMVVDKQLEEHISFTGRLSKEDWIILSKEFDIFLSTTNIDNTPVSVMESMALGMIVVSTNAGGVPFIIDNGVNGLLYNVGDLEGLVNTIRNVLSRDNSSLSLNARKKAESWDWKMVRNQWQELLDELVFANKIK